MKKSIKLRHRSIRLECLFGCSRKTNTKCDIRIFVCSFYFFRRHFEDRTDASLYSSQPLTCIKRPMMCVCVCVHVIYGVTRYFHLDADVTRSCHSPHHCLPRHQTHCQRPHPVLISPVVSEICSSRRQKSMNVQCVCYTHCSVLPPSCCPQSQQGGLLIAKYTSTTLLEGFFSICQCAAASFLTKIDINLSALFSLREERIIINLG